MRAIPAEFCPPPGAVPRSNFLAPQQNYRNLTVIYRNFFNQRAKGFSTKGNEDHEEKSRVSDSFFKDAFSSSLPSFPFVSNPLPDPGNPHRRQFKPQIGANRREPPKN